MDTFWLNDPTILLNKHYLLEIWPDSELSMERKLNAITRLIILLTIIGYISTKSVRILMTSAITLVVLVMIYKNQKVEAYNGIKEGFAPIHKKHELKKIISKKYQMPTKNNPLMNVMPTDYRDQPDRKRAAPINNKVIEEEVNKAVKESLDPKLFRNLGDNLTFEHSMRTFNAQPATTIPNNQEDFMKFCYGDMKSCKEGNSLQCTKNNTSNYKLR